MKRHFLLLAILVLSSFKGISQSSTVTVDPFDPGDSLVCFPQRYLQFMVDDIKQGKKDKVKVDELQQAAQKKDEEHQQTKIKFNMEREVSSSLRDSLEMKNSLITNLHIQNHGMKRKLTIWQGVALVLTVLFAVK